MKIFTNFNQFRSCLSTPLEQGTFIVEYNDNDTLTMKEHFNLINSKAEISLSLATSGAATMLSKMITLGQILAEEGSFIYVTDEGQLLQSKQYGTEGSVIYFVSDINAALKMTKAPQASSVKKKPQKKVEPKPQAAASKPAVKPPERPTEKVTEPVKPAVKTPVPEKKTETVKQVPEKTEHPSAKTEPKPTEKAPEKPVKKETPKQDASETPSKDEQTVQSFATPQDVIDKLTAIDNEFGKYPDHIIAGIKESDEADDLYFNLKFYIGPKLLEKTANAIKPHFDALKPVADGLRFNVDSVYKGEGVIVS